MTLPQRSFYASQPQQVRGQRQSGLAGLTRSLSWYPAMDRRTLLSQMTKGTSFPSDQSHVYPSKVFTRLRGLLQQIDISDTDKTDGLIRILYHRCAVRIR